MHLVRNRHDSPSPVSPSERATQPPMRKLSNTTVNTNFSHFAIATIRRDSSETSSPLFGPPSRSRSVADQLRQQADEHDQHLYSIPPSPLVEAQEIRKQTVLSWFLFGCAALFPPFLIIFRFGGGDTASKVLTRGRILTAARTPKQFSLYVGVTLCAALPITAIVLVVLFHFGVIFQ